MSLSIATHIRKAGAGCGGVGCRPWGTVAIFDATRVAGTVRRRAVSRDGCLCVREWGHAPGRVLRTRLCGWPSRPGWRVAWKARARWLVPAGPAEAMSSRSLRNQESQAAIARYGKRVTALRERGPADRLPSAGIRWAGDGWGGRAGRRALTEPHRRALRATGPVTGRCAGRRSGV